MSDIYFTCECGKSLAVDEAGAGRTVAYADCGMSLLKIKRYTAPQTGLSKILFRAAMLAVAAMGAVLIVFEIARSVIERPEYVPAGVQTDGDRKGLPKHSVVERHSNPLATSADSDVAPGQASDHSRWPETPDTSGSAAASHGMPGPRPVSMISSTTELASVGLASGANTAPFPEANSSGVADSAAQRPDEPPSDSEALRLLREQAAALPPGEEKYQLLREIVFQEKPPALRTIVLETRTLDRLFKESKQGDAFRKQLAHCTALFDGYNRSHPGRLCDGFYWFSTGRRILGYAIRTAEDYRHAEALLRQAWLELDALDAGALPTATRLKLAVGLDMAQAWVTENAAEVSTLFDALESMAMAAGMGLVGDIWGPNARSLHTRFMKYADTVPEAHRAEFMDQHQQRLMKRLLDDSTPMRNRAAALRGWITLLDKHGSLTNALPVIEEWGRRYANEPFDMNYGFARLWVELYGEGDWDKGEQTLLQATREARTGGRFFDQTRYAEVITLFYELQFQPGYELQRQSAIRRQTTADEARPSRPPASGKGTER